MTTRDNYGRFAKGIVPWNKGGIGVYSRATLEAMSGAKRGVHTSPYTEFKKGHLTWNKGLKGLYIKGSEKGWFIKNHKWSEDIEKKLLENLRKKVLLKPNLEMNENLAYILGLLKGDGYVGSYGRTHRIVLDTTDKIIADNFLRSLKLIGLNPFLYEHDPVNGIGRLRQTRVIAHSKIFCEWYELLSADKLAVMLNNKGNIIGFLRGFYEAEGWMSRYKKYSLHRYGEY